MSFQEMDFPETHSPNTTATDQMLDLLPDSTTGKSLCVNTRNVDLSRTDISGVASIAIAANANLMSMLHSLCVSQATNIFSTAWVAHRSAFIAHALFIGKIMQGRQRYEFDQLKALTTCEPLFKTTIKPLRYYTGESIVIHPEVIERMQNDEYLRKVIDISVIELTNFLKDEDSYSLDVFEESDTEVPRWTENVLRVRIDKGSFADKIRLWESLEEKIRSKIEEIRKQLSPSKRRKIDAINERLSIRVDEAL